MLNTHRLQLVALKNVPTRAVKSKTTKLMSDIRAGRIVIPNLLRETTAAALAQVLGCATKLRAGYWTADPPCHIGLGALYLEDLGYVRVHCAMGCN
jgi:hypothetical protein